MEKIKFGMQLAILMLAFPVWLLTEMKDADTAMKKNQVNNEQVIDAPKTGAIIKPVKGTADLELTILPVSNLVVTNI